MTRYLIEGHMRKNGAIGITYHNVLQVEAESPRQALLKAYETHEHLFRCTVTPEGGEPIPMTEC